MQHDPAPPLLTPDPWRDAIDGVAGAARQLEPVATGVLGFAGVLYALNVGWPLAHEGEAREAGRLLVAALPAALGIAALWDVRAFLVALGAGALWGPTTSRRLARIGDTLQLVALAGVLAVPNLLRWISAEPGGLSADLDPGYLALGGLGLLLALVGRMVGRMADAAAALKSDNEGIV